MPKTANGTVEMIRTLRLVRRSAMKARTQAANQLRAVLVTAPQTLRARLRALSLPQLVDAAARCRPGHLVGIEAATSSSRQRSPRSTPRSSNSQTGGAAAHGDQGVGADTAGALLAAAGDNPKRLRACGLCAGRIV